MAPSPLGQSQTAVTGTFSTAYHQVVDSRFPICGGSCTMPGTHNNIDNTRPHKP